jgi:hypothetical protein
MEGKGNYPFFFQQKAYAFFCTKLPREASFHQDPKKKKNHIDTCVKKDKSREKEGPTVWLDESKSQTLQV